MGNALFEPILQYVSRYTATRLVGLKLCFIDNVIRSAVLMFFMHVCCVIFNKV